LVVGPEEAFSVVNRDRPEPVNRDLADGEVVLADREFGKTPT